MAQRTEASIVAGYRNRINNLRGNGFTKSAARLTREFRAAHIDGRDDEYVAWVAYVLFGHTGTIEQAVAFVAE